MTKSEQIEQRAEALLCPILDAHRFELVDVEYVREAGSWYLRAYIDKEGGITIDDCELVSRAFEAELDREDFIDGAYILEVSSPGLGRPLKKERDYERAAGKRLELRTYRPIGGEKQFFGVLKSYDRQNVTIETDDAEEMTFARADLALIRLAFDF